MAVPLGELFPLTVLLMIATVPPKKRLIALAPPLGARFPLIVLFWIVTVPPLLEIPAPVKQLAGHEVCIVFPLIVLLLITILPLL